MTTATVTLTPSTDLQNIRLEGLGFAFEDAAAGAFIVLAECSYLDAEEVRRIPHDGSAASRAYAYEAARAAADHRQTRDGSQTSYNVFEEIPANEPEPVEMVRIETALNAAERMQAEFFGGLDYCGRRAAVEAAHAEALEENAKIDADDIALDFIDHISAPDMAAGEAGRCDVCELEPAIDATRYTYPELVTAIQIERCEPAGSKPAARGLIALMIEREQSHAAAAGSWDDSDFRDALCMQLTNAWMYGVLTVAEYTAAEACARNSRDPQAMLTTMRAALVDGWDLLAELKAGE